MGNDQPESQGRDHYVSECLEDLVIIFWIISVVSVSDI